MGYERCGRSQRHLSAAGRLLLRLESESASWRLSHSESEISVLEFLPEMMCEQNSKPLATPLTPRCVFQSSPDGRTNEEEAKTIELGY
jgi:hypothetical protein